MKGPSQQDDCGVGDCGGVRGRPWRADCSPGVNIVEQTCYATNMAKVVGCLGPVERGLQRQLLPSNRLYITRGVSAHQLLEETP